MNELDKKPVWEMDIVHYESYDLGRNIGWNECLEAIQMRKDDNWIPCSERLPEEDERYKGRKVIDVLVTTAKGKVTKVQRQSHNGYWWWGRIYGEPTAWQPLPEPYKGANYNG